MDFQEGEILLIDKPLGWTSFDVVNKLRRAICQHTGLKRLKVGHAGTLDPLATGVMLVCTGRKTKLIDSLQAQTKQYIATLRIGATTPSFDREHPIDTIYPTQHITRGLAEQTLQRFVGEIWQVPPVYSAVKVDGKRAYDYARHEQDIKLRAKQLVIDELLLEDYQDSILPAEWNIEPQPVGPRARTQNHEPGQQQAESSVSLEGWQPKQMTIRVTCSKGTYIRALARDIGLALNSGCYLTSLRRTRVGDYDLSMCRTTDEIIGSLSAS